jgi:hypothetical protein
MSLTRYLGNRAYSRFWSNGLGPSSVDCQSGFRAFTKEVAKSCNPQSDFTYTQEQYLLAARRGFEVASVDVSFYCRRFGESRLVRSEADYMCRTLGPNLQAKYAAKCSSGAHGLRPRPGILAPMFVPVNTGSMAPHAGGL